MTLLRLDQVSRRYGGVHALHELTLTVDPGARHAVIGANGAGKTTLFNLIAGSLRPSTGRIRFNGRDITRTPAAVRARHGIGRTFQHPGVIDALTTAANLELARTRGTNPAHRTTKGHSATSATSVDALLHRSGLTEHADTRANELPYGQRRRLEIAVVLAAQPRLLLLDEPSAGLSSTDITWLTDTIRALPTNVAVILIDHHLDLVWELADTVTVLHHGRHITTGAPADIRINPDVQAAYLGTGHTRPRHSIPPPPAGQPVLRVRHLTAGYHGTPVLHDLNLDLAGGQILGLLGRNGAGKTTLLHTVASLLPIAPGSSVELAGTRIPPHQPGRAARAGIALVPQDRRLFPTLTVAEHLHLAAHTATKHHPVTAKHHPVTGGRRWTRHDILTLFPPLHDRLRHHPGDLSGGEQQMLAIARALLAHPRVLALDEPGEGLAPTLLLQLGDAIAHIAGQGVAILLAEQRPELTSRLAHHILVLDRGRIALNTPGSALANPDIQSQLDNLLGVTATGHRR